MFYEATDSAVFVITSIKFIIVVYKKQKHFL